jgi:conjugal transfer pilus assembly protein TraW
MYKEHTIIRALVRFFWLMLVIFAPSSLAQIMNDRLNIDNKIMSTKIQTIGQTYPILEQDFISVLQDRFADYEKTHPEGLKVHWLKQLNARMQRIQPTRYLSRATQYKYWYYDPTIIVKQAMRDAKGELITPKGTIINPLITRPFHETLIFFDPDDEEQKRFVRKKLTDKTNTIKLIVVQGHYAKVQQQFDQRLYVDQHSELVTQFNIQHLPALITQYGLRLKIEEQLL